MPCPIKVDCQPGHGGKPTPHALHFGRASVAVKDLLDSRDGWDHQYFKLLGEDGATYIVRHDMSSGLWELTFDDSTQGPAK